MELSGRTAEDKKDGEYSGENVRIDYCTPKSATSDVVDTDGTKGRICWVFSNKVNKRPC